MKQSQPVASYVVAIFVLLSTGCSFSNPTPPQPTATVIEAQIVILPQQPTPSPTPIPFTPVPATGLPPTGIPSATHRPTNTPALLPSAAPSATLIPILPTVTVSFPGLTSSTAVILVKPEDVLNVRQSPNSSSLIVGNFAYAATGIALTGKQRLVGNVRWDEVQLSGGKTGWINDAYITEAVPVASFCSDSRVAALFSQLTDALVTQDGTKFAALVSPKHGLFLQDLRGGTIANYTTEKARWVFESTYVTNWGNHPGSGLPVKGTFSQEVLPNLLNVFTAGNTKNCQNIAVGGTTYAAVWPKTYQNINFYSLYRPGSPNKEMDWRTWLVGIEYVGGQPYLFALNQLMWEP